MAALRAIQFATKGIFFVVGLLVARDVFGYRCVRVFAAIVVGGVHRVVIDWLEVNKHIRLK